MKSKLVVKKVLRKPVPALVEQESTSETEEEKSARKSAKFVEIAGPRISKVLNYLDLLGNCSNKSTYESTSSQRDKIFATIRKKVDEIEMRFNRETKVRGNQFNFE